MTPTCEGKGGWMGEGCDMTGSRRRQFSTLGGTGFHPEGPGQEEWRGHPEPSAIQQGQRQSPALGRTSPLSHMGCGHLTGGSSAERPRGLWAAEFKRMKPSSSQWSMAKGWETKDLCFLNGKQRVSDWTSSPSLLEFDLSNMRNATKERKQYSFCEEKVTTQLSSLENKT